MISAALCDVLCCPECRGDLRLGFSGLECGSCARTFPIRHGIPRFTRNGASTRRSVLQRTPRAAIGGIKREAEAEATFASKTAFSRADLAGKVVLDASCGAGRYLDVISRWGATAIGVDFSNSVDIAAQRLESRPHVALVQADPFRLPFKDGVFDAIYSGETLQLVEDARRAFLLLPQHLKAGGTLAVWLDGRGQRTAEPGWRALLDRVAPGLLASSGIPDHAEPSPPPEMLDWFREAGFVDVEALDLNTAVRGRRTRREAGVEAA